MASNNFIRRKIIKSEIQYRYYDRETGTAKNDTFIVYGRFNYTDERLIRYIFGHTNRFVLEIISNDSKTEVYRMSVNEFIKHAERV